jgi:hypothetical protein
LSIKWTRRKMLILIVLSSIFWVVSGIWGFIYWWTPEYDLRLKDLELFLVSGLLGPFSWWAGYDIHGKHKHEPAVLIKKESEVK